MYDVQLMPTKESSLKKRPTGPSEDGAPTRSDSGKTVLRKTSVLRDSFFLESSFTSKSEATIFFPKVMQYEIFSFMFFSTLFVLACCSQCRLSNHRDDFYK